GAGSHQRNTDPGRPGAGELLGAGREPRVEGRGPLGRPLARGVVRASLVRAAGATAAGLAAAHAIPALAAVPGGRRVFRTTRHLEGARDGRVALTFDDGPETAAVDAFVEALG